MFACLRGIQKPQSVPQSPSVAAADAGAAAQHQQPSALQLEQAVFSAVVASEHSVTRHHEGRGGEQESGVASSDAKAVERRLAEFVAHAVQKHLIAITYEAARAALPLTQQEQDGEGGSAAVNHGEVMGSEADVAQLLWMNRTMALGTTITELEGTLPQRKPFDNAAPKRERHLPNVQKTVQHLREFAPALRAVLLEAPRCEGNEATHPQEGDAADAAHSETHNDNHHSPHSDAGAKRRRAVEEGESDAKDARSGKRPFAFAVRIDGGLMRHQHDNRAIAAADPSSDNDSRRPKTDQDQQQPQGTGVSCRSGALPQGASNAKCQTTLNVDNHGKLSLAHLSATTPQLTNVMFRPLVSSSSSSLLLAAGNSAAAPAPVGSQKAALPAFTVIRRPPHMPMGWQSAESVEGSGAEAVRYGANVRESRYGNRSVVSRRREEEDDAALGSGTGGQSSGGFITASEQLAVDVKAGRALASSLTLQRRTPALGLRRSGFTPPFQQQRQQTPPPHSSRSDVPSGVAAVNAASSNTGGGNVVPVNEVLSSIAKNSKGSHEPTRGARSHHNMATRDDSDSEHGEYPASLLLPDGSVPPILQPLDPKLVAQVAMEILEHGAGARSVSWNDIAGLDYAKRSVEEAIVWPLRRPDLFVGLRDPPRGLLLFGPPGTGKTMIARAIANRAQCTFLNISASSLMSKWMGDGEKLVRCLFAVATVKQPSVIFIDEIDSLLSMRGEGEMDSVRRVKTEFLVQLDGVATDRGDRVLLIGATNRPEELDEAARRRMEKRLHIPLPDAAARVELVQRLLHTMELQQQQQCLDRSEGRDEEAVVKSGSGTVHALDAKDIAEIAAATEGYSGADLKQVCREAAMGPLREVTMRLSDVSLNELRPIQRRDFMQALKRIRPSVGASEVERYEEWNKQFGSFATDAGGETENVNWGDKTEMNRTD
ncbi:putative katanin-like protein, putative,serine peptidase, Clan SJ, family S16 [Trypanosoma grayi]|uniref:putative katanin-like protein, putative,serine peptidase, Clan SJ, family S16 n=1 Tax=Trypanosoma grayi TaxID=71804 RepID=UPI0004F46404|nr:putative katanin-like protein, putative,serine peptidase, Clan SJ, family S16 [Trypanosoma grayi]KEG10547.1 putative katanin-like protein, putative,serine peptidase, Clan SJ, family S16 [Trypanosoma grayi]